LSFDKKVQGKWDMEEEEIKGEAQTELDSSATDDSQTAEADNSQTTDAELEETGKPDLEVKDSLSGNAAGNEASTALSSAPEQPDENRELPEAVEKKEADQTKQTDGEVKTDKKIAENPLNEEKPQKGARKILSVKLAVSILLIATAFCGFFIFDNKSKPEAVKNTPSNVSGTKRIPLRNQQRNQVSKQTETSGVFDAKIREISTLRDSLLRKREEILELKRDYQKGIDELEKEISDEMQREGISTFLQAMNNGGVEFGLQTIQRRQSYIRKLERPLNWILEACEELLYLKRQTMVDLQVAEIASGIDLNRHMQQMNAAAEKYKLTADKLALDLSNTQPESLETIWERIEYNRLKNATAQYLPQNQVISEQICRGDFGLLAELTEISAKTAGCIAGMQGSGLFLNGMTELTPAAARILFQWKGSWICLNGLKVLSPRVARDLFQWNGNWISLNGLAEFPAEIGEALLQWNGTQLELMGLQYTADSPEKIGIEFLAQWERSGGKLFVPDDVRKKIDASKQ
jgi:hypothetical protein